MMEQIIVVILKIGHIFLLLLFQLMFLYLGALSSEKYYVQFKNTNYEMMHYISHALKTPIFDKYGFILLNYLQKYVSLFGSYY